VVVTYNEKELLKIVRIQVINYDITYDHLHSGGEQSTLSVLPSHSGGHTCFKVKLI